MFYMCSNISSMVNVKWFFGIPRIGALPSLRNLKPFWETTCSGFRLETNPISLSSKSRVKVNMTLVEKVDWLSNFRFGRRVAPYGPQEYSSEVASLMSTIDANPRIPVKILFLGPSVSGPWTPEQVWDTAFINRFKDRFYAFTVQQYVCP
jgi:hypothetical protein